MIRYFDAHNHLQDERLDSALEQTLAALGAGEITGAVVNGSCEADWEAVRRIAIREPRIIPSFGYHPWYLGDATAEWKERLTFYLDSIPSGVGEVGLDRWIPNPDVPQQERFFTEQLAIAAERDLPLSIHCLRSWGRLLELLESAARPSCGFLLHSYGGPVELLKPLARLGGYFSFPGYFLAAKKELKREVFRSVPRDRLLIETDAPDQCLPPELDSFALLDDRTGRRINHPLNIAPIYRELAQYLGEEEEVLARQVEENFSVLFGRLLRS